MVNQWIIELYTGITSRYLFEIPIVPYRQLGLILALLVLMVNIFLRFKLLGLDPWKHGVATIKLDNLIKRHI